MRMYAEGNASILYFASPFFQAVLDGDWKETHPSLHSLSDSEDEDRDREQGGGKEEGEQGNVDRGSKADDPPSRSGSLSEGPSSARFAPSPRSSFYTAHFTLDQQDHNDLASSPSSKVRARSNTLENDDGHTQGLEELGQGRERRRSDGEPSEMTGRLKRLATPPPPSLDPDEVMGIEKKPAESTIAVEKRRGQQRRARDVVAIIDLSEEEASTFQDFLCLVYPSEFRQSDSSPTRTLTFPALRLPRFGPAGYMVQHLPPVFFFRQV